MISFTSDYEDNVYINRSKASKLTIFTELILSTEF